MHPLGRELGDLEKGSVLVNVALGKRLARGRFLDWGVTSREKLLALLLCWWRCSLCSLLAKGCVFSHWG